MPPRHSLDPARLIDSMVGKEDGYKEAIKMNHSLCGMVAKRLAHGGEIETTLLQSVEDEEMKQKIQEFLGEQRERLKALSQKNAQSSRDVDAFNVALQTLKKDIAKDMALEQDTTEVMVDYESRIKELMESERRGQAKSRGDLEAEKFCVETRKNLGEKEPRRAKRRKGDDSDDELEVVDGQASVKCPITGLFYEDPMKNKVCDHVYSRSGIIHLLKRTKKCPVAGCTNTNVSMGQLEADLETTMRVKHHKRRLEAAKSQQDTQDLDSSEDEFEG